MGSAEDNRPLAGVTVLVTRARAQAASLVRLLEDAGATVRAMPVIEFIDPEDWAPTDSAIDALDSYEWVVFSSANAVERFVARLTLRGVAFPAAGEVRVAAVGPATANRCREYGIEPDMVPDKAIAEGLIEEFERLGLGPGTRVLVPRAAKAREILPETLRGRGAVVDVAPVYRTVAAVADPDVVAQIVAGGIDVVTFTSPSTVDSFFDSLAGTGAEAPARALVFASIGPVTTTALVKRGLTAHAEAQEHTSAGLVDALVNFVSPTGAGGRL